MSSTGRLWRAIAKPPLRLARRVAYPLLQRWIAAGEPDQSGPRVSFLLQHAYGMGGTIRAVFTLAGELAESGEVEVISVVRSRRKPFFAPPARVRLRAMHDRTGRPPTGIAGLLARLPSLLVHEEDGAFGS
ncbi:MAG: hypothetical protein ACRDQB_17470, partial [Thermocrispum sp.]